MEERLGPAIESAAYRVIQEALTNVAKHAQATRCLVRLRRTSSTVFITVEDDGIGFALNQGESRRGLGLIGIRERASQLKGSIRIESAPGHGTSVIVELPAPVQPDHWGNKVDTGGLRAAAAGGRLG